MEGQYRSGELERWTARAAESYQELARVFSSYVTDKKIEEQELSLKQPDGCGGSCSACAQLARTKQSAYNQMLEGKEALVYQLEETARYLL